MSDHDEMVLTDDIREKMLGIMPFSDAELIEFEPPQFKERGIPEEFTPVFTVKALNMQEKKQIERLSLGGGTPNADKLKSIVRSHITNWRNLYDAAKRVEIPYEAESNGIPKADLFNKIPDTIVTGIFQFILKISGLIEGEKQGLAS